ncbi:hypothetical protein MLPF_0790 [Mycobacterium lepromatosis]|nr:hypothetical protein MLPF_0790 [Mycobacterium lepromatosis]
MFDDTALYPARLTRILTARMVWEPDGGSIRPGGHLILKRDGSLIEVVQPTLYLVNQRNRIPTSAYAPELIASTASSSIMVAGIICSARGITCQRLQHHSLDE